jgi:hypothetical protein
VAIHRPKLAGSIGSACGFKIRWLEDLEKATLPGMYTILPRDLDWLRDSEPRKHPRHVG